ncbi:tsukushi-like [Mya arenaria]|uniref:tsukushi-like n=1 Tax=Mya arenaria TaxID=6604 RepID=UPI0022E51206|nr:tsukushi-like [Mya arenaria]
MLALLVLVCSISLSGCFYLSNSLCFGVCDCSANFECAGKNLTSIPTFELPAFLLAKDYTHQHTVLNLNENRITSIRFGAFKKLSALQMPVLYIQLSSNKISHVNNGAFLGVELLSGIGIDLSFNNITSVPLDLTRLNNIISLDLSNNPIQSISDSVVASIFTHNNNMHSFTVSSYELLKKVMSLERTNVHWLTLDGMTNRRFEPGFFQARRSWFLKYLTIKHSQFEDISEVLCNLELESLKIIGCPNVGDTTLQGCQVLTVKTLEISDGNLTNAWDPSALYYSPIVDLTVSGTFDRVPTSILGHWPKLQSLSIGNKIRRIEKYDLEQFHDLASLRLDSNPLAFVDDRVFENNTHLSTVYLPYSKDSHLTRIPTSLLNLTGMNVVSLPNMVCSCETMDYMKGWHDRPWVILGADCSNIDGIRIPDYIDTKLPLCT